MLFILKKGADWSTLKEKLNANGASYRYLNLYGKELVVAWPDSAVEQVTDSSVEIKVKPKRPF